MNEVVETASSFPEWAWVLLGVALVAGVFFWRKSKKSSGGSSVGGGGGRSDRPPTRPKQDQLPAGRAAGLLMEKGMSTC